MNRIPRPDFDDEAAIRAIANNHLLKSHPRLIPVVEAIALGYTQYGLANGNAQLIQAVPLDDDQKMYLIGHYGSPPAALRYIDELRIATEHLVCPMCGSMHRGTLDHILPKARYAEFSVYSMNLVPACKCNIVRGNTTIGPNPGERVLHPYYDECLSERLVVAKFEDLGPVPRVTLKVAVDVTHSDFCAIGFHVASVLERTSIRKYLREKWVGLCRKPSTVLRFMRQPIPNAQALRQFLEMELEDLDDSFYAKNNWNSIFVAGLLDEPVVDWLFQCVQRPGYELNGPLID